VCVVGAPRPEQTLDGEVVRLGAAGGEDDLGRTGAQRVGDPLTRLFDGSSGAPTGRVQGRRVAGQAELLVHRDDDGREHRRRGGVVEVRSGRVLG